MRVFFLVGLSLRAMKSCFIFRQDLLLAWASPGNYFTPEWVGLAALAQTSLYYQLLMSLIAKLDLNSESVTIEYQR